MPTIHWNVTQQQRARGGKRAGHSILTHKYNEIQKADSQEVIGSHPQPVLDIRVADL